MLDTQKSQAPAQQTQKTAAAPALLPQGPDNSVLGGALGLVGVETPDIGAHDWFDAAKSMGEGLGPVVFEAMLLTRIHDLVQVPWMASWMVQSRPR